MVATDDLKIGNGIYTIPEVSRILRLPYQKVRHWSNKYWDEILGTEINHQYSWTIGKSKAVSFHTLIEFYVFYLLAETGVKTKKIIDAHIELSKFFNSDFPFAKKGILENIKTDGSKIYFLLDQNIISLDGTKQFNLSFIETFFENLEFDSNFLAARFWPLGKEKNIVIDPKRQFGHPVIGKTNIYPETLNNLFKSGEPIDFIAFTYEISKKDVQDAIDFCQAA